MKLGRLALLGGISAFAGYWLMRYLRPEHSQLVLNQSVVLITGASSGIGRAYANAFARRGARIVLAARRADLLAVVHKEIEPYADDVLMVPTDVTQPEQLRALVDQTLAHFGQIDLLINNAGVILRGSVQLEKPEDVQNLFGVNLAAAVNLTALCLPSMLSRRSGRIINVASLHGRMASPLEPIYAASKSGLITFSNALRRQLAGTGVGVISVLPSYTTSDMVSPEHEQFARSIGSTIDSPDYVAERTVDGILNGQREIVFGDMTIRLYAWLDRHFTFFSDGGWRYIITPEVLANADRS